MILSSSVTRSSSSSHGVDDDDGDGEQEHADSDDGAADDGRFRTRSSILAMLVLRSSHGVLIRCT